MSVFKADCPHCGTNNVAFSIVHQHPVGSQVTQRWDTLATCGRCTRGVVAGFKTPTLDPPISLWKGGHELEGMLVDFFPSRPRPKAPDHTPENVAGYYRQGMENLPRACDAAGSMFRKVLDTGLKAKFPREKYPKIKGTLKQRIQKAAEQHELTPELAEWSHKIRLDGNDAAHDEEAFSEEDARTLQTFTELVLTYLFTLPGMLRAAQDDAEAETGADPEPTSDAGIV